jgi:hypothetical protein
MPQKDINKRKEYNKQLYLKRKEQTKQEVQYISIMKKTKYLSDIKYESERNYDFVKWSSNILFCNLQMMQVFYPKYLKHKEYKQQHKILMRKTFDKIQNRLIIIRKIKVVRRKVLEV